MVLRNAGGLLGLAGISAVLFGGAFGWTLPLFASAVAYLTPPDEGAVTAVATWIFQPMEVAAAAWTAAVLGVAGAGSYALFGGRH
jgi:hypothetical protein